MLTILEIIIPIVLLLVAVFVSIFVDIVYYKTTDISECNIDTLIVAAPIILTTMCFWLMSAFAYWPYYDTIILTIIIFIALTFISIPLYVIHAGNTVGGWWVLFGIIHSACFIAFITTISIAINL